MTRVGSYAFKPMAFVSWDRAMEHADRLGHRSGQRFELRRVSDRWVLFPRVVTT